jgi:hypothetical protein
MDRVSLVAAPPDVAEGAGAAIWADAPGIAHGVKATDESKRIKRRRELLACA